MDIRIEKLNGDYSTKLQRKVKMDLLDFAELVGAEIEIRELEQLNLKHNKYSVGFKNCYLKSGIGSMLSINIDGKTINQALKNFAKYISEQQLVFNADAGCNRFDIKTPKLIYKPSYLVKRMFKAYTEA